MASTRLARNGLHNTTEWGCTECNDDDRNQRRERKEQRQQHKHHQDHHEPIRHDPLAQPMHHQRCERVRRVIQRFEENEGRPDHLKTRYLERIAQRGIVKKKRPAEESIKEVGQDGNEHDAVYEQDGT